VEIPIFKEVFGYVSDLTVFLNNQAIIYLNIVFVSN